MEPVWCCWREYHPPLLKCIRILSSAADFSACAGATDWEQISGTDPPPVSFSESSGVESAGILS